MPCHTYIKNMAPQSKDSHNPNQILRTYYEGTLFATVVLSIKSNVSIFVDREWQYQAGKKNHFWPVFYNFDKYIFSFCRKILISEKLSSVQKFKKNYKKNWKKTRIFFSIFRYSEISLINWFFLIFHLIRLCIQNFTITGQRVLELQVGSDRQTKKLF